MSDKILNTRIILRNDELTQWETAKPVLSVGEVALVRLNDNSYKVKVGDGSRDFTQLPYISIGYDQLSADPAWSLVSADIYDKIAKAAPKLYVANAATYDEELSTSIESIYDAQQLSAAYIGDLLVVAKPIDGEAVASSAHVERTAYYLRALPADTATNWEALDGNYSADNVIFAKDVVFAGNYTLGNKKTSNEMAYTVAKGTSVAELMEDVFTKELFPGKPVPTASISIATSSYEVGATYTPTFTLGFNAQTYTYGSNTEKALGSKTGVAADSYTITYSRQGASTTLTGDWTTSVSDTELTVVDGDNVASTNLTASISLPATGTYIPLTNIGNECLSARVDATTATKSNSNKVTGWRRCFWGYRTVSEGALDISALSAAGTGASAQLRDQIHATASRSTSAETAGYTMSSEGGISKFKVLAGTKQLIFAVPHDWNVSLKKIKLNSSSAGDLTMGNDNMRVTTADMKVYGLTTSTVAKDYDFWFYTADGSFAADTDYTVSFSAS